MKALLVIIMTTLTDAYICSPFLRNILLKSVHQNILQRSKMFQTVTVKSISKMSSSQVLYLQNLVFLKTWLHLLHENVAHPKFRNHPQITRPPPTFLAQMTADLSGLKYIYWIRNLFKFSV
jgi:hypothetical protein